MFSIIYLDKASSKIENFVNSYKNNFLKLYSDTGIYGEDEIIRNYEVLGDKFYSLIKDGIRNKFTEDTILGIHISESGKQYITVSINNFRLFIYYIEEKDENLRVIEDIEIFKK